jgi:phosphate-selective porin OprO/OprP
MGQGGPTLLWVAALLIEWGGAVHAQNTPTAQGPAPAATAGNIDKQLQEMREENRQLMQRFDALARKYDQLSRRLEQAGAMQAGHYEQPFLQISQPPRAPAPLAEIPEPDYLFNPTMTPPRGRAGSGSALTGSAAAPRTEEEPNPDWLLVPTIPTEARDTGTRAGSGSNLTGVTATPGGKVPMYRVGLFWWRDDTAEIAGRGEYRPDMPPAEHEITENVFMGGTENGLTWRSRDGFFSMTFHNLTQLDLREPSPEGDPLHGGFIIPRQRWYFEGKVGDYANFVTSVNRGYASFDVLDSYVDFIVNPEWLQFRVGRMKTPSMYEYIAMDEANLIGPERSIYVQNFAGNRQLGAMAHGRIFDRHFEYYAGVFNGPRRSFEDTNSDRDFYFYLDYRPFRSWEGSFLQGLHMVGAYNFGVERNSLNPLAIRTMNQLSASAPAAFVSPTVLEFNTNAMENGARSFWSYETVYYYKSWGFLTGVQGGYQDYSMVGQIPVPGRQLASAEMLGVYGIGHDHIPITGWSAQTWWFVTGEEITRRRFLVEPRHPFGYYNGTINPGAIELFAKVSNLQLSSDVFKDGLVNPAQWTNRVTAPEVGVNWYLNHFVKFTFDWQYSFLGNPVILAPPATYTKHYNMFLWRTQLFF